ncbi:HPr(Ser) kinase/phosphatase [Mycoplasma todarodis]|uniref:HPr(Ser) kinase/phosphatase n=1 Tax=Mycoplasma todarodis TaxID=1937191 RepID=A0A4R0XQK3_9MOLU|nr:HPr(Ser) kinase/phosphatase [Mycoplasma todarodis]TCG11155.1 HPr(Ser) kinase/phosphatase [Mycoplasma todarodis]
MANKQKAISVKEIIRKCEFTIANEKDINEWTKITSPGIYRAGLELCGFILNKGIRKNVIVWGTKEQEWFNLVGEEKTLSSIEKLFSHKPPVVFLSVGIKKTTAKKIIEVGTKHNVPIIVTDLHVTDIIAIIRGHLAAKFNKTESVHASLVIINGVGVMIIGKSGIGKSEAVIELIQQGHIFVSDDTVNITRVGKDYIGTPATITKDLLEARGIGLLDIRKIFGVRSVRDSAKIELVVELIDAENSSKEFDRLGNGNLVYNTLGGHIPKTEIPVKSGKSIRALITAATNLHVAKKDGFDSFAMIQKRMAEANEEDK